ncbi:hypothetical protein PRUPE_7G060800 [Prunus persica]|uniref:Uncharacterized protein n=1 Tax=Prunus persica TaxID=3760 RepID=A0A251N7H3_PRUPE|nr:hypothetical protein PRUPE_7G060800 [Prunus persica]
MAIPRSLKLIRLLKKAWSTLKQSNARRNKNQKNRATASLPSVLSQIQKLDTIYVETAADMEVVQKLINAQEPWKGTHIVVKTKQDATTATIKQKAKELDLEVIEIAASLSPLKSLVKLVGAIREKDSAANMLVYQDLLTVLKVLWNLGAETLVGRTLTQTTTTPEQATVTSNLIISGCYVV